MKNPKLRFFSRRRTDAREHKPASERHRAGVSMGELGSVRTDGGAVKRALPTGVWAGTLVLVLLLIVNALLLSYSFTGTSYELEVGQKLESDVICPFTMTDEYETELLRQRARDAAEPVYVPDETLIEETKAALVSMLANVVDFLNDMRENVWEQNADYEGTSLRLPDGYVWQTMLSSQQLATALYEYGLDEVFTESSAYSFLGYVIPTGELRSPDVMVSLQTQPIINSVNAVLEAGVYESELEQARSTALTSMSKSLMPAAVKLYLAPKAAQIYVVPTMAYDAEATIAVKTKAANAVEEVRVSKGDVIIAKGSVVTRDDLSRLSALGLQKESGKTAAIVVACCLFALAVYGLLWAYLFIFDLETLRDFHKMLGISCVMLITLGLGALFSLFLPMLTPALTVPLMTAAVYSRRNAIPVTIALAFTASTLACPFGGALVSSETMSLCLAWLAGGLAAIFAGSGSNRRAGTIMAGLVGGGAGGLVLAIRGIAERLSFGEIFMDSGLFVGGAVISVILAIGLTVFWETIFDLPTDARLNELTNPHNPLIRKLINGAPGTYHHCVAAAQLAENAAEEIGANAVLAGAAAMYHDVGKLKRPYFFGENLGNAANPHDDLPPEESVRIITAHQSDAEPLLQKYRIPRLVRRIIAEHHGNTQVAYFYYKAKKLDPNVNPDDFRYNAPRPSSKESVIVMLADSCEAAVRSLTNPSEADVTDMIHKVIKGKVEDGQFSEAPVTMQELSRIEKSFIKTFVGMAHDRIRYPGE